MSSELSSLLALDSHMSEESVRVAVYDRAMKLQAQLKRGPSVEEIADQFMVFVGSEHWRLSGLDIALHKLDRHGTVEGILEEAEAIVAWVKAESVVETGSDEPDESTDDVTLDDLTDPEPVKSKSQFKKRNKKKGRR